MALSHTFCSVLGLFFFTVVCHSFRYPYLRQRIYAGDKDTSQETVWRDPDNSINYDDPTDNALQMRRGRCATFNDCRRDQWCSCNRHCHATYAPPHCSRNGRSHLLDEDEEKIRRRKFTCQRHDSRRDKRCESHHQCGCGRRCSCDGFCHSACPNGR